MRVIGIDSGSEITGYGIVEQQGTKLLHIASGAVRLAAKDPLPKKLRQLFAELSKIIVEHHPDMMSIENVFYAVNAKSALKLGHVRGVAMLAAANAGLDVAEYAPLAIKSAVVGYGKAEKSQVQEMVMRLLQLDARPEPPDIADALAIAICHLHTAGTLDRQKGNTR